MKPTAYLVIEGGSIVSRHATFGRAWEARANPRQLVVEEGPMGNDVCVSLWWSYRRHGGTVAQWAALHRIDGVQAVELLCRGMELAGAKSLQRMETTVPTVAS